MAQAWHIPQHLEPCSLSPPLNAHQGRWQRRFDNAERDKAEFQPCNYLQAEVLPGKPVGISGLF